MSVKIQVIVCIALLTIVGAVYIVSDLRSEFHHDPEYTAQSSAVYTDDYGIFFMEDWNGQGRLYRINRSGEVLETASSKAVKTDAAEVLAYHNGKVYALYSSEKADQDGVYNTFRIAAYDTDLKLESVSDFFAIDSSWKICSMTADDMCLYISAITNNGGNVTVFSVPVRNLTGIETLDSLDDTKEGEKDGPVTREDYITPDSILFRNRTTERFYVDARYIDPELHVLLDGDTPEGDFAPDLRIKTAVDNISFSPGQRFSFHMALFIRTLGLLIIWIILIILALKLTRDRDRIVYLFLVSEVVFFVILFLAFFFIKDQFQKNEIKDNTRFALMIMQDDLKYYSSVDYDAKNYFDSTKYYRLMDNLTSFMNQAGSGDVFHDVFVMRKSSGLILADAKGHNGIHASYLYGGEMSSLMDMLKEREEYVYTSFTLEGQNLVAVAYESDNPNDDIALVAICKDKLEIKEFRSSVLGLGILFIVIFVLGSILLFIALYLQHMDLKHFSSALKKLALGESKKETSKTVARDMRELWQSYGEISKRIEEINYDKYRIFEAYYRFAPKGIEQIMGKESIFDVKIGDRVSLSGAIVLLSVDHNAPFDKKITSLSNILTNMESYGSRYGGILVSRERTLSNLRFLMMNEQQDTVSQIVQFIHTGKVTEVVGWSVMMYKDVLTYGVAGSPQQSLIYIDSNYSRKMDAYAEWFRGLGVPLVATERILSSEDAGEVRYIGCADLEEDGAPIRFYDVLDAYPAQTRQLMLMNRDKFHETMELFYSKDFYLARNQFMEILKDCPEDGITRWYIFECEKYMNGEADVTRSGYIQIEE